MPPAPPLIKPTGTVPDYTKYISHIGQCTYIQDRHANRKTYRFKHQRYRHMGPSSKHFSRPTPPPEYIASIFNSQVTQISYTALYKHLVLLSNDSLQLCLITYSSTKLCKCYKDYFHSRPIYSYTSTCSILWWPRAVLHKVILTLSRGI